EEALLDLLQPLLGGIGAGHVQAGRGQKLGHAPLHTQVLVDDQHLGADALADRGHARAGRGGIDTHGGALKRRGQTSSSGWLPGGGNVQLSNRTATQRASGSERVVLVMGWTRLARPDGAMLR